MNHGVCFLALSRDFLRGSFHHAFQLNDLLLFLLERRFKRGDIFLVFARRHHVFTVVVVVVAIRIDDGDVFIVRFFLLLFVSQSDQRGF